MREIFTGAEIVLWARAARLVDAIPFEKNGEKELRCHELARAVGAVLELPVQDGRFGFVDHSWLWLSKPEFDPRDRWGMPHILDVYAVGSLPQVQLVDDNAGGLPRRYYPDAAPRDDIDEKIVSRLVMCVSTARIERA